MLHCDCVHIHHAEDTICKQALSIIPNKDALGQVSHTQIINTQPWYMRSEKAAQAYELPAVDDLCPLFTATGC